MITDISKHINALQMCVDIKTFKQTLRHISNACGFEYFIYNIQITNPFDKTRYFAIGNYPTAWLEVYESNNYAAIDPVLHHCISCNEAIFWHETYSETSAQKIIDFFSHAKAFNLQNGISKSLKINEHEIGVLSLATNRELLDKNTKETLDVINNLQEYIHKTMLRVSKNSFNIITPVLTTREREILFHLAKGDTSAEVAKTLNISETTVVFYVKNIIQKLDAKNRTHAIIKAVSLNLIDLNTFKFKENAYNW